MYVNVKKKKKNYQKYTNIMLYRVNLQIDF